MGWQKLHLQNNIKLLIIIALANFLQIFIALHPFSLWGSLTHCYYYAEG